MELTSSRPARSSHVLTIANQSNGSSYPLSLPGVYRVSVNPGGSMALAFVQNSNYAYYPRELTTAQSLAYSGGPATWPKAAVDCEPQNAPGWCLFQVQSPDQLDATGNYYGAPLVFDRPTKAVFSADGSTAYVLNCGPECGGTNASISLVPVAPLIFLTGKQSGLLPCNTAPCANPQATPITNIPIPSGASNALVNSSTMYVVGQRLMPDGYFGGFLYGAQSGQQHLGPFYRKFPQSRFHQRWIARRRQSHDPGGRQYPVDRHDQMQQG